MFAVLAISFLIIRTITAFLTAQNQIGTRMVSTTCSDDDTRRRHHIQVLVVVHVQEFVTNIPSVLVYERSGGGMYNTRNITGGTLSTQTFDCGISTIGPFVDFLSPKPQGVYGDNFPWFKIRLPCLKPSLGVAFQVEVRSGQENTSAPLSRNDIPRIWLLNSDEQPKTVDWDSIDMPVHAARTYLSRMGTTSWFPSGGRSQAHHSKDHQIFHLEGCFASF
ncbi:hypothetical protein B0J17DRAFT_428193 [Rhizoctonia solani]|nr:hypothetical protein B0J17DRAFT_428193 [Rhizoctonia solani]